MIKKKNNPDNPILCFETVLGKYVNKIICIFTLIEPRFWEYWPRQVFVLEKWISIIFPVRNMPRTERKKSPCHICINYISIIMLYYKILLKKFLKTSPLLFWSRAVLFLNPCLLLFWSDPWKETEVLWSLMR